VSVQFACFAVLIHLYSPPFNPVGVFFGELMPPNAMRNWRLFEGLRMSTLIQHMSYVLHICHPFQVGYVIIRSVIVYVIDLRLIQWIVYVCHCDKTMNERILTLSVEYHSD
jgi:hypothetical protein